MTADGVLNGAAGHLEQVRRCDFHPEGYALDIHGAPFSAPSTWDCTNSVRRTQCSAVLLSESLSHTTLFAERLAGMAPQRYRAGSIVSAQSSSSESVC